MFKIRIKPNLLANLVLKAPKKENQEMLNITKVNAQADQNQIDFSILRKIVSIAKN